MQIYTPLSIETETVMIRNLIYHIWPTSLSKSCWMWAVDKLSEYIHVFNGKIVVAIAIENSDLESYKTDSKEEVVERFLSEDTMMGSRVKELGLEIEFFCVKNYGHLRECTSFYKLLNKIESLDENEITFYCHAKGVRWQRAKFRRSEEVWTAYMLETNLSDIERVEDALSIKGCFGCILAYEEHRDSYEGESYFPKRAGNNAPGWFYDGTFFWFNNKKLFSKNWCYDPHLMSSNWNGVEWYLCNQFSIDEAFDNTKEEHHKYLYRWKYDDSVSAGGACYNVDLWYRLLKEDYDAISWFNIENKKLVQKRKNKRLVRKKR